jgi:hypothetical protein
MSAYLYAIFAAVTQPLATHELLNKTVALALGALALCACSALPPAVHDRRAADPAASAPPVIYRSAIGGFVSRRPVDPDDWKSTNERVTPPPKAAE